ncbi:copper homeostasis protein cutC homolog isoform X2 [Cephus cinctus]|nr:copper homeostasis protein cutC homolog isoform X2 [Cephus cinctus]XP_015585517.1 copper homeostasis protein cutC homolog isoform X2 [Cephus cinctus]XP_024936334.1 copper homeostasis protein cutC homolog isoform X2 [Cephus cinctus]
MEICIDCIESARNAINGGAMRLEICSALSEGGLTPSPGLVKFLKNYSTVPIYAMIRMRSGNFVYSHDEMESMLYDLKILKELGVDGFVFGALTEEGDINMEFCLDIIKAASPRPVTFHRAFDEVSDPYKSLEILIDLGFERILTSGQENSAEKGIRIIEQLVKQARERIIIMPGAGITTNNLSLIKKQSGANQFHASARKRKIASGTKIKMGNAANSDSVMITDEESVRDLVKIIKEFPK